MLKKIAIIAAGGTGSRLQSSIPKQYLLLQDKPVLMHTISAFIGIADRIVLVLHKEMIETWETMCEKYGFNIPHDLVVGGDSRFQSVRNALIYLENDMKGSIDSNVVIAIHDAARPLVSKELIKLSFEYALEGKSNVLGVKSTDSIRMGDERQSRAVDRNIIWKIQTPQTFPAPILLKAYEQDEMPIFTDDASVVEHIGHKIQILESTNRNLKLTFKEDFKIASFYLSEGL